VGTALETRSTSPLMVSVRKEPTVIDVCELSVVIPTRNEAGNIVALHDQLSRALVGHSYEVIVVDDSNDAETRPLLRAVCADDRRWTVIERPDDEPGSPPRVATRCASWMATCSTRRRSSQDSWPRFRPAPIWPSPLDI